MPSYTPNMNLLLPDRSDYVSLMNYLNNNFSLSDAFIANLKAELEAEIATLDGNAVKNVLGIAPDASGNVTFDSSNVKYTTAGAQSVKDLIDANGANITSIGNTVNGVLTDLGNANSSITGLQADVSALETDVSNLKNLGHFLGSFPTYADVPTNTSGFTGGIVPTPNDVVDVLDDETRGDAHTRYTISSIAADGTITYAYIYTYTSDTSGLMPKVAPPPAAGTIAAFNADGTVRAATSANIQSAIGAGAYMPSVPFPNPSPTGSLVGINANGTLRSVNASNINDESIGLMPFEHTISPGTTSQYWRGDKTWQDMPTVSGGGGKKFADFVVGNAKSGHTASDCDVLYDDSMSNAVFLEDIIKSYIDSIDYSSKSITTLNILVLNGHYQWSGGYTTSYTRIDKPVNIDFNESTVDFYFKGIVFSPSSNDYIDTNVFFRNIKAVGYSAGITAFRIGDGDNSITNFKNIYFVNCDFIIKNTNFGCFFTIFPSPNNTNYANNLNIIKCRFDISGGYENEIAINLAMGTTTNRYNILIKDCCINISSGNFISSNNSVGNISSLSNINVFISRCNIIAGNVTDYHFINFMIIQNNLIYPNIFMENNHIVAKSNVIRSVSFLGNFVFKNNFVSINYAPTMSIGYFDINTGSSSLTQDITNAVFVFEQNEFVFISSEEGHKFSSLFIINGYAEMDITSNLFYSSKYTIGANRIIFIFAQFKKINFCNNSINIKINNSLSSGTLFSFENGGYRNSFAIIKNNNIKVYYRQAIGNNITDTTINILGNTTVFFEENVCFITISNSGSNATNKNVFLNIEINYSNKHFYKVKNNDFYIEFSYSVPKNYLINVSSLVSPITDIQGSDICMNNMFISVSSSGTSSIVFYSESYVNITLPGNTKSLSDYKTNGVSGINSISSSPSFAY